MQTPPHSPGKKPEVDIIDIRSSTHDTNLKQLLETSLSAETPKFPSLLLWDDKGLQHFEAVTYAEEYYLTNCETELLKKYSMDIARQIAPGSVVLELGSGNLRKIKLLLDALEELHKPVDYYALDLSHSELERTLTDIKPDTFMYVRCHGLLGTYDEGNEWLRSKELASRSKCILSLGSTVGSDARPEAAEFLKGFAEAAKANSSPTATTLFIIGVDGCTDGDAVWKAYNDSQGCNTRFISNMILAANKVLGHEAFNPDDWVVCGEWNKELNRHDQFLIPKEDVHVNGVNILKNQKMYVVSSYKYDAEEQSELWDGAGLQLRNCWRTEPHQYALNVLSVA